MKKKKEKHVIMMTDGASAQVAPEEYRLSAVGTNETHKARGPPRLKAERRRIWRQRGARKRRTTVSVKWRVPLDFSEECKHGEELLLA